MSYNFSPKKLDVSGQNAKALTELWEFCTNNSLCGPSSTVIPLKGYSLTHPPQIAINLIYTICINYRKLTLLVNNALVKCHP